ncbi:RNA polymerase sigma-70 factor, ECF subfamily [Dyadobacter sp. SG02]|uniref:RNA polymerase sigma factor n=1 Tax=Dyadobacter sp. SG02 TaxID=1855291 RepID=UPI0008C23156|nr:RNA polymerase sigma factor [Dyadobacter sp. SG02]SEI53610.1 RNA polymerase sigma-70 factor, ECF subfamily [Dyadobacter sp. SG02]
MPISANCLIACQQQDRKAQAALYEHYKGRLLGFCRRYARTDAEAEDIMLDSFLKIFAQLHTVKRVESLDAWVKSVTIRTAIDHYRSQLREPVVVPIEHAADMADNSFHTILDQLNIEEIQRIIALLPTGYRMVFNLYLIDGFSHAEIAQLLGISEGTSKSQLSKAKTLFSKTIKGDPKLFYAP